jgi:SAM-dependent methyltransferase
MSSVPIPPDDLLQLVSGHANRDQWDFSRRAAVHDVIIPLLAEAGIEIASRRSILDFGCGCGRILAGWEDCLPAKTRLTGVDVNPTLVSFCRDAIGFARTEQCGAHPPLPFSSHSFDLIYAASVFTHMTKPALREWADEMARISAAGGVLMISFHGNHYHGDVNAYEPGALDTLKSKGCYVHIHGRAEDTFEGSNDYATYMTEAYVLELFDAFVPILVRRSTDRGPTHFAAYQDIVVFRKV